ncbi:MAG: hypothetical protein U1D55_06265 [Phycisphaerae bacterium]
MRSRSQLTALLFTILAAGASSAGQQNIDLATVPPRDGVQLTIYNSEDLTLVRETRTLSFKRGVNPLQFSWANTLIDASSVELRFATRGDQLSLLDTTFPHAKPQMLYWNVQSEFDGAATVEITYFTSGISWAADYVCIAGTDEQQMSFEGFVRITNHSGEDYEDASVRLVVGTINLVEKVAELAKIPMADYNKLEDGARSELRARAFKQSLGIVAGRGGGAPSADQLDEKQIIKQGLSEYFIYTIEGTETIPNGWAKRMRSFNGATVPLRVQYRYRPVEYGEQLVRMYLLTNDKKSQLGETPLPDGMVRVFRDNGRDGLSFLVQQSIRYVPIGDKIELNLGPDPEVIFEWIKLRSRRDNIWIRLQGADVYRRVDDGNLKVELRGDVAGWDDRELYTQRIRNYSGKPIEVEIRRLLPGDVLFRSSLDPKLFDFQTVEFTSRVDAGKRVDLLHEVVRRQGYNAKQNRVELETADLSAK